MFNFRRRWRTLRCRKRQFSLVRKRIGRDKVLGASCYNCFDLALSAQQAGASYVAFGACFTSRTKPNAPVANLNLFKRATVELNIPTVAIGGITLKNAAQVIQAGADAIAVINAIFNAGDVKLATENFIVCSTNLNSC